MEVLIRSCLEGAKDAQGIAVIIDVFRASNTIIACLGQKADYIIPVGGLDEAYDLKERNPQCLLFRERKGLPPKGFDHGNSPAKASKMDLSEKGVILTTSAGSQGIVNAENAFEILIASFANANAIAPYIQMRDPGTVTLVPIGFESHTKAVEDEECATHIKELLGGGQPDYVRTMERIMDCDGAKRLKRLGQLDDLEFCMEKDTYDIVPRYDKEKNRMIAAGL